MKLAYIHYHHQRNLGIEKKMQEVAAAAELKNLPMDFFLVNDFFDKAEGNLRFSKIHYDICFPSNIFKEKAFRKFRFIQQAVPLNAYDAIVLRYPTMGIENKRFFKRYGPKIITEHHCYEVDEILGESGLKRLLFALIETYCRKRILPKVAGIIGVTNEIRRKQLRNLAPNTPSLVLPNGISVQSTPFTRFQKFNGKDLTLVFIASYFASYQGLERLIEGAKMYSGNVKFKLILIGEIPPDLKKCIQIQQRDNVHFEIAGRKTASELNAYYGEANLGIGSLGFHTKNLKEACTLKVREYMARGLPFIYAYDDPDFSGNEPFSHKFSNEPVPVDFQKIVDFARKVTQDESCSEEMRQIAFKKMDWSIKIQAMYRFACEAVSAYKERASHD